MIRRLAPGYEPVLIGSRRGGYAHGGGPSSLIGPKAVGSDWQHYKDRFPLAKDRFPLAVKTSVQYTPRSRKQHKNEGVKQ
jgi:hypothetical protein